MRQKRFPTVILAILFVGAIAVVLALAVPALSQPVVNGSARETGAPPVSFILDDMIDAHEQDIKQGIFEYKFEAASGDPAAQAALVEERSYELKNDTAAKKGFLQALMARNRTVTGSQYEAEAGEVNASLEKLNGWSRKLEEHAAGLTTPNGKDVYNSSMRSLISDIADARSLASNASRDARDNTNNNGGQGGNAGQNGNSGKNNNGQGDIAGESNKGGPKK